MSISTHGFNVELRPCSVNMHIYCFNCDVLAQGGKSITPKEPTVCLAKYGDWTHNFQAEAAICPARPFRPTEYCPVYVWTPLCNSNRNCFDVETLDKMHGGLQVTLEWTEGNSIFSLSCATEIPAWAGFHSRVYASIPAFLHQGMAARSCVWYFSDVFDYGNRRSGKVLRFPTNLAFLHHHNNHPCINRNVWKFSQNISRKLLLVWNNSNVFKCIFLGENVWIAIKISL